MKRIVLSVWTVAAMSSLGFAGGDMALVEPVITTPMMEDVTKNFYAGIGISALSTRDADVSMDFFNAKLGQDRLGNVTLTAGYNFNEYLAAEGRYSTTFSEEDVVTMDTGWSLFVKPQYPASEDFSVYALLGFGGIKLDGDYAAAQPFVDVDDTGFQWGIGASYAVTEDFRVFVDYTSLANDMDGTWYTGAVKVDVDAITVGVNYLF